MKIIKSQLKQLIREQVEKKLSEDVELDKLQPQVDSIFDVITKEIEKTPEEVRGIIWSTLVSKIAEAAKEGEGSELQEKVEE
jgi:hypothetical protein